MLVRAEFRNLGQPHAPARQGSLLRPASSVADAGHLGECGLRAAMPAAVREACRLGEDVVCFSTFRSQETSEKSHLATGTEIAGGQSHKPNSLCQSASHGQQDCCAKSASHGVHTQAK